MLVTAVAMMRVVGGAAPAVGNWAISRSGISWDGWNDIELAAAAGATSEAQGSSTIRYTVPGNVAVTFGAYGKKLNSTDTVTVSNIELRVEVIKR